MLSSVWNGFLNSLEGNKKNIPLLYSLVKQLRPVEMTDKKIVLACHNQALRSFLEKKIPELERSLSQYFKEQLSVELTIEEKKSQRETPLLSFQPNSGDVLTRANLRTGFSFENFAVSGSNQVAYAASRAVCDNLGHAYNPLFLYGGVGVGKTHLAQAVGKKTLEKEADRRVLFCPGDQFTNELIESIREKSTPRFRRKYRYLNLLIIDDIQFIAGKQTIQEEFFHTFNSIVGAGGQIILTSDKPPSEIKNLEDRLRSRFLGGLIVDVASPDFELRAAILLIKAREKNIEIDINAAKVIAEQIEDTRGLEGTLLSIYAKILGKKNQIDLEAVDEFFTTKEESVVKKIDSAEVIKKVCTFYSLKLSQIKGDSRVDEIVLPRQIAMFVLRSQLKLKLDAVASILKRKDHTTVIHAVEKISRLMVKNPAFKEEVDRITHSLGL